MDAAPAEKQIMFQEKGDKKTKLKKIRTDSIDEVLLGRGNGEEAGLEEKCPDKDQSCYHNSRAPGQDEKQSSTVDGGHGSWAMQLHINGNRSLP